MRLFFIIFTFIFLPFLSEAQFYYGLQTEFGKSRVQYKEFNWTSYQFQEFDTYYYRGGKPLAKYTATTAHIQLQKIEKGEYSDKKAKEILVIADEYFKIRDAKEKRKISNLINKLNKTTK